MAAMHASPPPRERLRTQVVNALRASASARIVGQVVNWSITLFVMRILVPDDYGLVAMLSLILMFLSMIGDMGFDSSIVQSKTLSTLEVRQIFGAAVTVNGSIFAALMLCAPGIALFFGEPRLADMTRVAALGFIASAASPIYNGLLQRDMRFRTSARIEIFSGVVGNVATLGLALAGYGAWALILGPLIATPVKAGLLMVSASAWYWPSFELRGTRRLWRFGGNVLASRVIWYWSSQVDILIAGKMLGKEALGFYSVAVHLATLPMQRASGMINGVAFAAFSKIQNDPTAVAYNTRLGIRLMAFVMFPLLWGIAAVAPELVHLAIGPAWEPAILPMTLVALTIPFRMIGSIISTTIMSMGRVDIALVTTVIGACIAPPIFLIGARYGIVGLGIAWLVVTPILFLLNMFRALPILGLSLAGVVTEVWRPMTVSTIMFVVVEALRQWLPGLPDSAAFAFFVVTGALVYCAGTWLLNRAASVEALTLLFPDRFADRSARPRVGPPTAA